MSLKWYLTLRYGHIDKLQNTFKILHYVKQNLASLSTLYSPHSYRHHLLDFHSTLKGGCIRADMF